jgi:hypothetical protein
MGIFVKHEPCPKCGSRDNLARYMDGSAWCFGCHHRERGDRIPIIDDKWLEKSEDVVLLDDDLCSDFPVHVVSWLAKYDITVEEAIKHGWKYQREINSSSSSEMKQATPRSPKRGISGREPRVSTTIKVPPNKYYQSFDSGHPLVKRNSW